MKTANYNTLTEQVAQTLENEIYSGIFPPDTPLPSTRAMAQRFKVSQRIILEALNRLEQKDMLLRRQRKRVYVKSRCATANAHEILFFAFGEELELHTIYQSVNDLILNGGPDHPYDFFSRIVSSEQKVTPQRLNRELARLQNLGFIDCALCYSSVTASCESMLRFMRLPYPVIFLGELPVEGKLPEGARLLSPNAGELLTTAAQYAVSCNYREVIFAYWQPEAQRQYERQAMETMRNILQAHNINYLPVPVPGDNFIVAADTFNGMAAEIARKEKHKTLFITQNIHSTDFDAGNLLPQHKFPNLDCMTLNIPKTKGAVKYLRRDVTAFQNTLKDMIGEAIRHPRGKTTHRIAPFTYHVIEEQHEKKTLPKTCLEI